MSASLPGEVQVLDRGTHKDANQFDHAFFKLSYASNGAERKVHFESCLWKNIRTGATTYYDFSIDCPESEFDNYLMLYKRIQAAQGDA